jgi:hypothetical protein
MPVFDDVIGFTLIGNLQPPLKLLVNPREIHVDVVRQGEGPVWPIRRIITLEGKIGKAPSLAVRRHFFA